MTFLLFFSVFCMALGVLLLIIRSAYFPELKKETFISGLFITLGFVFILLSLFGVLAGFAENILGHTQCEQILSNTTINGAITSYSYVSSCELQDTLRITEIIYTIYLWVLFFIGLLTIGGSAYLLIGFFRRL